MKCGKNKQIYNRQMKIRNAKSILIINFIWLSISKILSFQHEVLATFSSVQSLSRVWLFVTPWTAPGLPVHHQLPELTQTQVHWVGDAIQPSHPLSSPPSPPALNLPSIGVFSNESALRIRCPKYWSFTSRAQQPPEASAGQSLNLQLIWIPDKNLTQILCPWRKYQNISQAL